MYKTAAAEAVEQRRNESKGSGSFTVHAEEITWGILLASLSEKNKKKVHKKIKKERNQTFG
jgi:hypothetical protein